MIVVIQEDNGFTLREDTYKIVEITGGGNAAGAASGDLSGTYPAPTVARIRGRTIDPEMVPQDGDVLTWNAYQQQWIAQEGQDQATGLYDPDAPPDNPSDYNDEFNDSSLGDQWEVDTDNDGTIDMASSATGNPAPHITEDALPGWLLMQNVDLGEFYLPFTPNITTDWTVVVKLTMGLDFHTSPHDFSGFIIQALGEDANHYFQVFVGTVRHSLFCLHTDYKVGGGEVDSGAVDYGSYAPLHEIYLFLSFWTVEGDQFFSAWISGDGISRSIINSQQIPAPGITSFTRIQFQTVFPDAGHIPPVASVKFIRFFEEANKLAIGNIV